MKRFSGTITILFILILSLLCGCTPAPPTNSVDELTSNSWILYDGDNNKSGKLVFSDGHVIFNADIGEEKDFKLDEEYIADNTIISVISENYGTFNINYTISGNSLTLSYLGKEITLKKEKNG